MEEKFKISPEPESLRDAAAGKSDKLSSVDQKSNMLANNDKNLKQKCVESCPISIDDNANMGTTAAETRTGTRRVQPAQDNTTGNICEKNLERDIVAVVCGEKSGERKSETEKSDTRVFTSVERVKGLGAGVTTIVAENSLDQEHNPPIQDNAPVVNRRAIVARRGTHSLTVSPETKQSPSKSPGYVRKPMPINEPKPILPKSKQINLDQTSDRPETTVNVDIRKSMASEHVISLEEEGKKLGRKLSQEDQVNNNQDIMDTNKTKITSHHEETRHKKSSTSPLSPRHHSKTRPSTLMLEKRDKLKRSSAVSATPSTDSSKSSKTFEFIDYDEETKAKILEDALKEEEEFMEFVKTLDIEPPDPIIEAGKDVPVKTSKIRHPSDTRSLLPGSRGQENLDSLCRMMEEIAVLKDQNNKLTEKLHYMEVNINTIIKLQVIQGII